MAARESLKTVTDNLKSSKITLRQAGLASLRTVFSNDFAVFKLDAAGNGLTWIALFQALFATVQIEKEACSSKKPAAAERRLTDTASTVRWLIERSVHRLNSKAVTTILAHLLSTIVHRGELLHTVSLDYVKAIRCLLAWPPHMEHLNDGIWMDLVQMAFNVVLGDPLNQSLEDADDVPEAHLDEGSVGPGTDVGTPAPDDGDDEFGTPSTATSTTRKRRRQSPAKRTQPNTSHAGPSTRQVVPTSREQVEFMSLLVILFQSTSVPLLHPDYNYLPAIVLGRLQRFLVTYPVDSSLHHDYLLVTSSVLSHLALNHRSLVGNFARNTWDGLVAIWGTKNIRMKEDLVVVLRALFPYLTMPLEAGMRYASMDYHDGISKLWSALNGEAHRWVGNGLALDSIRLQTSNLDHEGKAFFAKTFRYGWHFDASQALAWSILELHSDCAEKLYRLSESIHMPESTSSKAAGKRRKSEDPITTLLYMIKTQNTPNIRAYHLQTMLFFIDRHWSVLHDALQQEVISTLQQFVSFEDGVIQSWNFLCLAAIAYATSVSPSRNATRSSEPVVWDPIWTHAMRRSNVPGICRAACHTAFILLSHAKRLLTAQRVLEEIEAFARDLDVQGPAFPYDSVCAFIVLCLRIANQDVRLYRLQLEEKALTWITDAWRERSGSRLKMPLHSAGDMFAFLASVCALSKRGDLICASILPECPIVDALIDDCETAVIRNFLLYATLPIPRDSASEDAVLTASSTQMIASTANVDPHELSQPRGRERRISAFLLKSMEDLAAGLDASKDVSGFVTAEKVRSSLDFAIIALFFEAGLVVNGTRSTRRVIQAACRIVKFVVPLMSNARWTSEERALIISGLQPLVMADDCTQEVFGWETFLSPNESTGIRKQILRSLMTANTSASKNALDDRRALQRAVFQSADVQDVFSNLLDALRNLLRVMMGQPTGGGKQGDAMDVDDKDDFGPVRSAQDIGQSAAFQKNVANTAANRHSAEICMTCLALIPILQSTSGEPTRDKDLTELVLDCDAECFLFIGPAFLNNVRQRTLNLSQSSLDPFLEKLNELLVTYTYSRNGQLQLLVLRLLDSTSQVWLREVSASSETGSRVRELCQWFSAMLTRKKIRSWRIRDYVTRFLDSYLTQDPQQVFWSAQEDFDPDTLPSVLLPTLGADEDVRVRFRAAVANARMFNHTSAIGQDPLNLYDTVRVRLTTKLDAYEHMLTRFLCLANIMVASSAVRRGPYWHLLETCLYSMGYTTHIEVVLTEVGQRLGLSSFSELFESYASQLAYSIRQGGQDVLRFPPHLLGYRDRKECATSILQAFTPTNILADGTREAVEHGQQLFSNHCKAIQIPLVDGIRQCFPEIIGYQIVFWMDANPDDEVVRSEALEARLRANTSLLDDHEYAATLTQSADAIVIAMLRTLGDQDLTPNGPVIQALWEAVEHDAARIFESMTHPRLAARFETHSPNLPSYCTRTVLRALAWFKMRVPESDTPAITYHVLHQFFADVDRSPIVNEQMRLLNALCVWISLHVSHFEDYTLLRTIMNGATTMLAQVDLARAAQGILDWGFDIYGKCTEKDTRLPDILIRTSCLAYDYLQDQDDSSVVVLGRELLGWVENRAVALSKYKHLKGQIIKGVSAWPRELPSILKPFCDTVQSHELSAILNDNRISASKFRLVRRRRDLAVDSNYADEQFLKSDFWRFKECIPPSIQLPNDNIDAFATLLLLNQGLVGSFGSEQLITQGIRTRHRASLRTQDATDYQQIARRAIVVSLLAMLDFPSAGQSHLAYITLRSLASVYSSGTSTKQALPPELVAEMQYLEAHSMSFKQGRHEDFLDRLRSNAMLDAAEDFNRWIPQLTTLLCDTLTDVDNFYSPLEPVLVSDISFAEDVLPVLVHTILQAESIRFPDPSSRPVRDIISLYFTNILSHESSSIACLRAIVDIVLHLRSITIPPGGDALAYDKWLQIDYTLLSQSAIKCGAYTTALLFLELAAEYKSESQPDATAAEQIMFDIYSHIDEPDGFYGIRTQDLNRFLIKRLHHEKQWDKAFRFHGAALEAGVSDAANAEGVVQALHSFGFNHLAITNLGHSAFGAGSDSHSTTMSYQLGWRTNTWDLPEHMERRAPGASLYRALRAIYRERSPAAVENAVRGALLAEMAQLRQLGDENLIEIREVVQNLMCLNQITQWRSSQIQMMLQSKSTNLVESLLVFTELDSNFDFADTEAIMATRISLIRSIRQKEQREQIGDFLSPFCMDLIHLETKCLLRLSEAARHANQPQIALNSVSHAQRLLQEPTAEISEEFSDVLWLMKEPKLAAQSLRTILSTLCMDLPPDRVPERTKTALLLARLGTWSAEASLGKATEIMSNYFAPAVNQLSGCDPLKLVVFNPSYAAVYHQYAIFAERQYHSIVNSPDALRWRVYVDRKTSEIKRRGEKLNTMTKGTLEWSAMAQECQRAKKLLDQDREQFADHTRSRNAFLHVAIDMYSRCLQVSRLFDDDSPIRLCSLWFANFDELNHELDFSPALERVPSYKFVFLAHQLAARLSTSPASQDTRNQDHLQKLLARMCHEHPFHSLYQVYCLIGDRGTSQETSSSRRRSGRSDTPSSQADRATAASAIFSQLRSISTSVDCIRQIEAVCGASLEWAKYPVKKEREKRPHGALKVPDNLSIRKINNVRVPVITAHTPVDPTAQYQHCVWISHYDTTYTTAGGVNLPKITYCFGDDGRKYKQLFKGEGDDDLRQDAVMEQVFDLVNIVLRADRETKRRKLGVRGYKVIPLASQAGVLEFVENTTPLGSWLTNAHPRYHPKDLTHKEVSSRMKSQREACKNSKGNESDQFEPLVSLYAEMRRRFQPVMRHYFTERHKTPMSWFAMRLNYARSVATTSIVGHILGLGDRHTANILMDNGTGEVVHIDLGIAFEQGKLLPIPERVPFRLTPDMVDGLGVSGTQGVFQRCAEETLRVLRERSEVILTVLEVFKHDPLHSWTASELKVQRVQDTKQQLTGDAFRYAIGIDMASGTADEAADRALQSVSRKLDKALSVEYTVNDLVAEAADPANLALMYIGWGPHY